MTFIDYTPFYYSSVAKTAMPAVTTGKFVQLRNGQVPYLVFSPKELTKYHSNIIERFCMDNSIEGNYDSKREVFFIHDQAWGIVGGGKFERDNNNKTFKLYDNSMSYGKFDGAGLKEALAALPELAGFTIIIE